MVHDTGSGQPEDRVSDELAGAVVGHVAAPVDAVEVDAAAGALVGVEHQVGLVGATPQRVDAGMLEQQQHVADLAGLATGGEVSLPVPGRQVGHGPGPYHRDRGVGLGPQRVRVAGRARGHG